MKRITLDKVRAAKGSKFYSLLLLFLVALTGPIQAQTVTLGSGDNTSVNQSSSGLGPINAYYANMRFQVVYTAAEITAAGGSAGYIDQLGWNIAVAPEVGVLPAYTISMANSAIVDAADHIDMTFTQVFTDDYTPATTAGFDMIELDTPFLWDGVSNVVINVCYGPADYAGYDGDHGTVYVYGEDMDGSRYDINDYNNLCDSETDEINDFKPQVQFAMSPPPACLPVSGVEINDITATSAALSWTALATVPANGYDYYLSETATAPDSETVPTGNTDENSIDLTLEPLTNYYVWVRSNCGDDDGMSDWSVAVMFSTPGSPLALPVEDDFEAENNWLLVNGGEVNQWFIGDAVNNGGDNALYISNDGGTTNEYDNEASSVVHAFADVIVPEGVLQLKLSFDWSNGGEDGYDYFRVWTVPASYFPEAGTEITSEEGTLVTELNLSEDGFEAAQYVVNVGEYAGNNVRFVFEWTNDGGGGDVAAAAIDNISITEITCIAPNELSVVAGSEDAVLSWELVGDSPAEGFEYYISESDTAPASDTEASGTAETGATEVAIADLDPLTEYHIWIRSVCSTDDSSDWSESLTFTTLCLAPTLTADTPDPVCGIGSAELSATTSEGIVYWYTSATSRLPIGMGESIASPVLTEETSFYAEAASAEYSLVGATYNENGYSNGTSTGSHGVMVTTLEDNVYIVSAEIPFTGTGTITFELMNTDDEVVATATSPLVTGEEDTTVRVPINILVEDAGDYVLVVSDIDGTVDNLSYIDGAAYPFESEFMNVTSGYWYGETNSNMYLFNLIASLSDNVCISERQMVTVTTTEAPEIVVEATEDSICEGESTTLSVTSDNEGYTYVWMPGNLEGAEQTVTLTESTVFTVTATDADSGCVTMETISVNVNPLPADFDLGTDMEVCVSSGATAITPTGGIISGVILNESFNEATNSWTTINNSEGGNVESAAWTLRGDGYVIPNYSAIHSNDNSQVYNTNSDAQGSASDLTSTILMSPEFSTEGYEAVSVNFYHHLYEPSAESTTATVEASVDGEEWTVLATYDSTTGDYDDFASESIALTEEFLDEETVYIRFKYEGEWRYFWSIDNVIVSGTQISEITWEPAEGLYVDEEATVPYTLGEAASVVYTMPENTIEYTATVTSPFGCTVTDVIEITPMQTEAPTADAEQTYCAGSTVADLMADGNDIQWYADETGGEPLEETVVLDDVTYYATQTVNGCESGRTPVEITINVTEVPVADVEQTFCGAATVADLTAEGNDIQWYADETGGDALAETEELENEGVYYVSQIMDGCESARVAVTVAINVTPAPEGDAVQEISVNPGVDAVIEMIEVTGVENGVITWYLTEADALNNENIVGMDYVIENEATYYAVQTIDGCPSEPFAVTVSVVLGIKGFDSASFAYWPNPVKDVLKVSYSSSITTVTVYNLVGQPVLTQQINALEGSVNMANLSDGTYLVTVSTEDATKTIRVIKKQ